MEIIAILKKEHEEIRDILLAIESMIGNAPTSKELNILLDKFHERWDAHEKKEENSLKLFKRSNLQLQFKKAVLGEHRELRGHWRVIKNALKSDEKIIDVALDTDGRMLIEKLRKHMEFEENFFDKVMASENIEIIGKT